MSETSSGRLVKSSVQFTPEQHAALTEEARATGETVAAVLRQIVRRWMAAKARKGQSSERTPSPSFGADGPAMEG